ncbi:type II toxin-antitoxin system VapC family toxin [Candidatus Laterigemmans baculatus]|uniref:type II toxin-antitoxin system VapC family toxin n=1 Tax=Candidatus Laterigemmans baculatus TaxID=2770505 RepID=UPI0013D9B092|nr:PIN domain-containing protein [Candidatus Laterigemmans baculatus]
MKICLDTNVLIWGVRGAASPGQDEMVQYARNALMRMSVERAEMAIPTPVMSEYLVDSDTGRRENEVKTLRKNFQILPFDALAASEAALLVKSSRTNREEHFGGRVAIKFDAMILAWAIVHKCHCILTYNTREMSTIARGRIAVQDLVQFVDAPQSSMLPPSPRQTDLDDFFKP